MQETYDFSVIRFLRKRNKLTLEDLARLSGLTYSTVALIEQNKSVPSLKTLRAIAGVFKISTGSLISLAEHCRVQIQKAEPLKKGDLKKALVDADDIELTRFDDCRIFHICGRENQVVKVMELHGECLELGIVLRGVVQVTVEETPHDVKEKEVILFDGVLDHSYKILQDADFITVHIPKNLHTIESLLKQKTQ
ncbi:MAG: DNA-binding transcriptional repressor PuuR [Planctomycetes bacterium ADurb.Bin412]|nr:MAG: DNA-binding transcriptional repressor PuuR [Planctomycetes bacterium ADurb.Bin412]